MAPTSIVVIFNKTSAACFFDDYLVFVESFFFLFFFFFVDVDELLDGGDSFVVSDKEALVWEAFLYKSFSLRSSASAISRALGRSGGESL